MAIKKLVDDALKTPMTRKEFLGQMGAVFLAVIGITSILHSFGAHKALVGGGSHGTADSMDGYGSSAYGGTPRA